MDANKMTREQLIADAASPKPSKDYGCSIPADRELGKNSDGLDILPKK